MVQHESAPEQFGVLRITCTAGFCMINSGYEGRAMVMQRLANCGNTTTPPDKEVCQQWLSFARQLIVSSQVVELRRLGSDREDASEDDDDAQNDISDELDLGRCSEDCEERSCCQGHEGTRTSGAQQSN